MALFAVGSRNPVKLAAVRTGVEAFYPQAVFTAVEAASGVPAQPRGDLETIAGAGNRARAALRLVPDAEFGVGLEGGVVEVAGRMFAHAWCAVVSRAGQQGLASTGGCELPPQVADLIRGGMELGDADDLVFGRDNSKQNEGAVGLLTRGHIDRARFYAPAVTMALVRFLNPEHFPAPPASR